MRICSNQGGFFMVLCLVFASLLSSSPSKTVEGARDKSRHSKIRGIRQAPRQVTGFRECNTEESQAAGCLAGTCAALITSSIHTFVVCRCPPNRQGQRCEEIAINVDSMAATLQQLSMEELCKQEKFDILARKGYEASFFECLSSENISTNSSAEKPLTKKERRKKKKMRMRERKRKQKMKERARRRRERKKLKATGENNRKIRHSKSGKVRSEHKNESKVKSKLLTTIASLAGVTVPPMQ